MVEDKRQDIFGYNPSGRVSELQNINSDAWPLISGSNLQTERRPTASSGRAQTQMPRREAQPSVKRPSAPQRKPEEKKKTPYVSSSTGKAKKKAEKPEGRISRPPAGKAAQRPERRENKERETVNNKKRQPERTPKGKRV